MQRKVQVLPEHIANKIAAGEVVQRPESVVKELLENALDAGAKSIVVVVEEGGTKLIQVADDGSGMDEQDALNSFARHATSKIATYEDLEAIATFGFRGEALASIAAVAHVTMKTRPADAEAAVVIRVDGGAPGHVAREAREPGTTVTVRNLFFNVPARRKFLKSIATEFRHVYDAVQRVAISYPEVGIQFVSDREQILTLKPAPLPQRLVDVFGERQVEGLITVEERSEFLRTYGFIGKPAFGLRSRAHQYLFLNRRYIANRTINHAVYSGYENLLEKGTFPFFLLFLEIDPHRVDVNIHPSKMEVKFDDEQGVYRFVGAMVRKALTSAEFIPALTLGAPGTERGESPLRFGPSQHGWPSTDHAGWTFPERHAVDPATGEVLPLQPSSGSTLAGALLSGGSEAQHSASSPAQAPPPGSPVWQLHNKYILAAIGSGVMIVDQHVAHERVLYERALKRVESAGKSSQQLLFPKTVRVSPADYSLVEELKGELELLGFDLTLLGRNALIVQGVPPDVASEDEERILEEVLTLYKEYRRDSPTNVRDNLAKSYSCRSAIKAGDPLNETEMRSLLADLFATSMPYVCPHGRPIVLRISLEEMDRRFGRL